MGSDTGDARLWHFTHIPKKRLGALDDKTVKPYLKKWGFSGRIQSQTFAYNGAVEEIQIKELLQEFFCSAEVYPHLKSDPQYLITQPLTKVTLHKVPCTLTDLQIFERLCDPKNGIVMGGAAKELTDSRYGVVLGGSQLRQCFQRDVDGFLVADELRKLLLDLEDNELYSEAEKDEFLVRLFKHVCLGGLWCQYEDFLDPYLTVTKLLYKDLISVVRSGATNQFAVRSRVYKVEARTEECDIASFPRDPERDNNFAYVIVQVDKKYVTTLVHQAGWSDEK